MSVKIFTVLFILFILTFSPFLFALDLVKNGQTCAEIVLADGKDPVKKLAANELKKYLSLLTGKDFTITAGPTKKFPVKIHIGENIHTKKLGYKMPSFRKSAYDIAIGKDHIILNGPLFMFRPGENTVLPSPDPLKYPRYRVKNSFIPHKELSLASSDDPGILYAVTAFLEKLGVRFYGPGRKNTFIPEKKNSLSFAEGRITSESCFALREYLYGDGENFDKETLIWLKHLRSGSSLRKIHLPLLAPCPPSYYLRPYQKSRFFQNAALQLSKKKDGVLLTHLEYWHIPEIENVVKYFEHSFHNLPQVRREQQKYFSGFRMLLSADEKNTFLRDIPLRSLMIYLNSKLLWDPQTDLDALLQEYCRNMYQEASSEMLAFYRYSSKIWERPKPRAMTTGDHFIKEKDLKILAHLLAEAKKRAGKKKEIKDRISLYEKYVKFLAEKMVLTPKGKTIYSTVLPIHTKVDLDERKYKNAPLKVAEDTFLYCGIKEDRQGSFFLLKSKKGLAENEKFLLAVTTPLFSHFEITIDGKGNALGITRDPELLGRLAYPELYIKKIPLKMKKTATHTLIEFSVIYRLGRGPSGYFSWGIMPVIAGKDKNNAQLLPPKSSWYELTAKNVDSKGNKLDSFNFRILTPKDFRDPKSYVIRKTQAKDFLSSPWDGPVWGKANTAHLQVKKLKAGKKENVFFSKVAVKLLHDDQYIYGLFKVDDKYVKAVCRKDQGSTCLDSCVEIFLRPGGKGSYYNFEFNCTGKLLCWEMHNYWNLLFDPLTAKELQSIKRFHTLKGIIAEEIKEDTRWYLGFQIPVEIFVRRNAIPLPLSGQIWTGAFMKCAGGTSHPNNLTWKKMETFHWPEDFGTFFFE